MSRIKAFEHEGVEVFLDNDTFEFSAETNDGEVKADSAARMRQILDGHAREAMRSAGVCIFALTPSGKRVTMAKQTLRGVNPGENVVYPDTPRTRELTKELASVMDRWNELDLELAPFAVKVQRFWRIRHERSGTDFELRDRMAELAKVEREFETARRKAEGEDVEDDD